MITRTFKLCLNAGTGSAPRINVSQYDEGETWLFELYSETGERYIPTTGAIVGVKSDGHGIVNTGTVDSDGRVVITETQQMTAAAGRAIFELSIDGLTHGTANFVVAVERKPTDDADLSDSDLSLIQEAVDSVAEIEDLLGGQDVPTVITPIISDWLDENITNPSNPPIDTSLAVAGAAADSKKVGDEITDLKSAISLSQNLVPKSELTPNPKTVNGVTVTVLGPGKLHLSGTATAGFAVDHYINNSALPFSMEYGVTYYAVAIGGVASVSKVFSYGETLAEIYKMNDAWGYFEAPQSGGLAIRTIITGGVTYDETVEVVIIKDNVYTKSITNFNTLTRLITDSNLPINYAVESTAKKTHNGLTFSAAAGVVTVNGTSSDVAYYDFFRKTSMPEEFPFKEGHTYSLRFADETPSPLIYKQVQYRENNDSSFVSLYSRNLLSDAVIFTMPTCYDFYVRLVCDSANVTYSNKKIDFIIEEVDSKKDVIVVDVNGGGDFTSLKTGIEYAMLRYGTKIIVKQGTYDLVTEFGKSYLDSLSGNDFGIMLGNGIELEFAPNAYVTFDYDGTNDWVIANFSPFNTANDLGYTIDGLHCTAHNCRYILHDDPRPSVKGRYSKNVIRNCYFELFPSTEYSRWVNHQIIGGGLGDSTMVEIENCIFNDHFSGVSSYSSVSYHNSTSGSADYESRIIVKDCYFMDGNNLTFEGYGSSTKGTKIIAANNNLENGDDSIIYSNAEADNMLLYKWNNHTRT